VKFSVGITCHNYARYVSRAIDSALSQGAEVLVSDNASTDHSQDVLAHYDDQVTLFLHDVGTINAIRGLNECLDAATGDWFIALDADDYLAPGALRTFERFAEGFDWMTADLNLVDEKNKYVTRWAYESFPRDRAGALEFLRERHQLPISMKGAFSLAWIRENDLHWSELPSTTASYDVATCLRWLEKEPRIGHIDFPLINYCYKGGSSMREDEHECMVRDMDDYLARGTWE
jgi:glycosyltransferase involved in cell wall biosynthesis